MDQPGEPGRWGAVSSPGQALAHWGILLQTLPLGIGLLDGQLRYIALNDRLAAINGLPVHAHLGRPVAEVVPELWPQLQPVYQQVLDGRTVPPYKLSGRTAADEAIRHWRVSHHPVFEGEEVVGASTLVEEVTDAVVRTRRLAEKRRMLQRAEVVAAMGSWELDVATGTSRWSPGMHALLGVPEDEPATIASFRSRLLEEDRPRLDAAVQAGIAPGQTVTHLFRLRDGERCVEVRASADGVADGAPGRITATVVDVTARLQAEAEREQLQRHALAAADAERRRIAEHLHNDALQALAATMLRLERLRGAAPDHDLDTVRRSLLHVNAVLRDSIVRMDPVGPGGDLASALQAYADELFSDDPVEARIVVDVPAEATVPEVVRDAAYRIAQEALANARRHAHASQVDVRIVRDGAVLRGEVLDDGIGLGADGPVAPNMGLRLMHERAQLLGGVLTVDRRPDGGTAVTFDLPTGPVADQGPLATG